MADRRDGNGLPEISPVLFLEVSGESMRFFLRPGPTKVQLQPLIRAGGGCVCRVQEPGAILLADPEEEETLPQSVAHWYVSTQYIHDCVEKNIQLEVLDYRFDSEHMSRANRERGSKNGGIGGRRVRRRTYTEEEDDAILRYIRRRKMETSGNTVWQELAKHHVIPRSWQSMKDRYKKYLMHRRLKEEEEEEKEEAPKESEKGEAMEKEEKGKVEQEVGVSGSNTVRSLPASRPPVKPGVLEPSAPASDSQALMCPPPPPPPPPQPSSSSADALEMSLKNKADQTPTVPQRPQTSSSPQKKRTVPQSRPCRSQHNKDLPEDPKSLSSKRARLAEETTPLACKSLQAEVTTTQSSLKSVQPAKTLPPKSVQSEETMSSKSAQSEETLFSTGVQSEETLSSNGLGLDVALAPLPSSRETGGTLEQGLPAGGTRGQGLPAGGTRGQGLPAGGTRGQGLPAGGTRGPGLPAGGTLEAPGYRAATWCRKEGEREGRRKLGILEQATREFEVTTDESEEDETPELEGTPAVCVAVSMTTTSAVRGPVTSAIESAGAAAAAASRPVVETQSSTDCVPTEAAGPGPAPRQPDPQTSRAHLSLCEREFQPITDKGTAGCSSGQPMTNSNSDEGVVSLTQCQLEEDKELMRMLIKESNSDLVSVTKALLKTSGDIGAALEYLRTSRIATPLWSRHDDSVLLSGDPLELHQLREKHGEEAMAKRRAFLA